MVVSGLFLSCDFVCHVTSLGSPDVIGSRDEIGGRTEEIV